MNQELRNKILIDGRHKQEYDIQKYNLVSEIQKWFGCENLSNIHQFYDSDFELLTFDTGQATVFHKHFYSMPKDSEFYEIYRSFIKNVIQPQFTEEIIFQKIPTFRTQVPGNYSVAAWHKDSDYNHVTDEVNIFLPMTKAFDNNTIWAESQPLKEDYTPMNAIPGEYYIWSGCTLVHGNKVNDTGLSRVSIDFRVLPYSKYHDNDRQSTSNKTKMVLGHYFDRFGG
jgi:ectoine hydroxylase-related dioxygenase (phytanoyl-CoA dioxygenase family)